jgi:hypothetical protein
VGNYKTVHVLQLLGAQQHKVALAQISNSIPKIRKAMRYANEK